MSQLARGALDFTRGLRFLGAHPRLWGWIIAPALVTLGLLIAIIGAVARFAGPLVARVTGWLPDFLHGAASGLLWILLVAALGIGAWLVFVSLAGVVAGPFCERLSRAVEAAVTGRAKPEASAADVAHELAVAIAHALRRLIASIAAAVALFAIAWIPAIGSVAALLLGGWFAARAAAYDVYDSVLARRHLSYRDKLAYLAANRGRTSGLGAAVAGLLLVPGVNLVALGIGSVGATLAALE